MNDTNPDVALAPQVLSGIENLQLRARKAATGALAGIHRSLRRGTSIEFHEHKLYTPGDDIRRIDWRAYAKSDRYHVKQFEDETNLSLELLVDHSNSMRFSSASGSDTAPSKLETARTLAAALAYLALRQGDTTGLTAFAGESFTVVQPRATSSHLVELLTTLVNMQPTGATNVGRAIDLFLERRKRRAMVVVLSDLLDPHPQMVESLRRLAAHRHDVVVLHILDRAEVEFPYDNPAMFAAMEDNRRLFVHPRTLKATYVQEFRRVIEDMARQLAEAGIEYHRVDTRKEPAETLADFLRPRAQKRG